MSLARFTRASTAPLRTLQLRAISTSAVRSKSLTDSVKETADAVNKKVGQTLASGLEGAQNAADSVKETVGVRADQAKAKVDANTPTKNQVKGAADYVKQTVNEAAADAKVEANKAKQDAKSKL
ncbi:hypothetical protein BD324DRAFT_618378 [Kockovaella imperatae]|uniref:Uncharacterized protein n=1 Tax=Kockovaella imperatae TaxID=4999 RepID=A0A1Y1UNG1_9TREE|nr:hypothetical protein BD324DRAFT_618378 [Kockovaella imperatae]ORX39057.1 hypothetical protein BD324DRAFT_618378 [Kockovaella imperatae]